MCLNCIHFWNFGESRVLFYCYYLPGPLQLGVVVLVRMSSICQIDHITLETIYLCKFGHKWSGRPGVNPRSSHTKDSKMVLDAALLSTQHYKVRIKSKVEQSREWSSTLSVVAIEKRALRSPSTKVSNFILYDI